MPLQTMTDTSSTLITFHSTSYCTTLPTYTGSDTTLTNKFDFAETVCSLIDHRWRQNVLKTKTWCTSLRRVCHWCFYNILTSDLLLNSLRAKWNLFVLYHEQKGKQRQIKLSSYRFTVWGFVPVRLDIFQVTNATLCLYLFFSSLSLSFFQGLSEWARTSKRRTGCPLLARLHRETNLGNIHLQPVRH